VLAEAVLATMSPTTLSPASVLAAMPIRACTESARTARIITC